MTLLSGLDVTELTSPELTGEWKHKLKQIEQGGLGREAFMREIAQMTQVIVKRAKEYERDTVPGDYATLQTPCPKSGAVVKENYRRFACTACDFSSASTRAAHVELPEVEELLAKREIGHAARLHRGQDGPSVLPPSCASATNTSWNLPSARTSEDDTEAVDFPGYVGGPCPSASRRSSSTA